MSSLATGHKSPRLRPRSPLARVGDLVGRRLGADLIVGLALGAALCALTFITRGGATAGTDLGPNTWGEVALVLLGAALGIIALRRTGRGRAWGAVSLGLFGALAALTQLSISWSVQPDSSWLDANLTFGYLAAFGGGLALARMAPERWAGMVGAVVFLAVVVSGYALLGKVFPGAVARGQILLGARLSAPYGYWNAIGLVAALGVPGCVWLGAQRGGRAWLRALSVPALGVLVATVLLSYSRGALAAGVIGLAVWFVFVPLRLRGAVVLVLGAVAGGAVMLWALGAPGITSDGASAAARRSDGHSFGLVLVVMLALAGIAGALAVRAAERTRVGERARRRAGGALLALLACVPVLAVVALAASSRGFTGELSYGWSKLTSANVGSGGASASRLLAEDNSHARYWSEGLKVGSHALLKGVGGLGFGTASLRYSSARATAVNAHSFWIETFADFGLIGVAVSLALFLAWLVAAARTVGAGRVSVAWIRGRGRPRRSADLAAERAGLLTLLAVVVVFGVHSSIDWTWFIPGLAVPALLCAGWLAGRGPLAERPGGEAPQERAPAVGAEGLVGAGTPAGAGALAGTARWARPPRLATRPRRTLVAPYRAFLAAPGRAGAGAAIVALALVCAWSIWQPLRSTQADSDALTALAAGHPELALADARSAAAYDPLSTEPRTFEADIYSDVLHDPSAARAALQVNVRLQPSDPATWLALGMYDLQIGQPREAIAALEAAQYLYPQDPTTPSLPSLIARARSELR